MRAASDLKLVLLGNKNVGKTSIFNRYVYDEFGKTSMVRTPSDHTAADWGAPAETNRMNIARSGRRPHPSCSVERTQCMRWESNLACARIDARFLLSLLPCFAW